jgi:hypothetical protein
LLSNLQIISLDTLKYYRTCPLKYFITNELFFETNITFVTTFTKTLKKREIIINYILCEEYIIRAIPLTASYLKVCHREIHQT